MRVEVGIRAGRKVALRKERSRCLRLAVQGSQDVERDHVARSLPHRAELDVAVELRHRRLLDVAVAAEALERLGCQRGAALADPVLHDRQRQSPEGSLLGVLGVEGPSQAHGRSGRRLGLQRDVGEHVHHRRLLGERCAERRTVARVPDRLGDDPSHHSGDGRHRVKARPDQLLDDEGRAAPLLAEDLRRQVVVLDL